MTLIFDFDIWLKSAIQVHFWSQPISTSLLESLTLCLINNPMIFVSKNYMKSL